MIALTKDLNVTQGKNVTYINCDNAGDNKSLKSYSNRMGWA